MRNSSITDAPQQQRKIHKHTHSFLVSTTSLVNRKFCNAVNNQAKWNGCTWFRFYEDDHADADDDGREEVWAGF